MNMPLPKTTQGVYRLSVSTFYFLQGLVFASLASRIPDIKSALGLNDADLGSVLFAVPVGQMSAMALSGYLVGRCGSRKILMAASVFYPAVLVCLGMAGSFWEQDLIVSAISRITTPRGISPDKLSQSDRVEIIRDLNNNGMFLLKGAVATVAEVMGVSEPSVYRYLQKVKKEL